MDVARYVLVGVESAQLCKDLLAYLWKRKDKYNWILRRPSRLNKENSFFFWWNRGTEFSATSLRSFLKRLRDKEILVNRNVKPFTISRKKKTYDLVHRALADEFLLSHKPHTEKDISVFIQELSNNESHAGEDLSEFLHGLLRKSVIEKHCRRTDWAVGKCGAESPNQSSPDIGSAPPPPPPPPPPLLKADGANVSSFENIEVVEEDGLARSDRIERGVGFLMKMNVRLLKRVEQIPTDISDLLGKKMSDLLEEKGCKCQPNPAEGYFRSPDSYFAPSDPYQQIPPAEDFTTTYQQIPPAEGSTYHLQMF